ncbi:MAG: hypothetical protein ACLP6G_14160 [Terriglobales bacterium]
MPSPELCRAITANGGSVRVRRDPARHYQSAARKAGSGSSARKRWKDCPVCRVHLRERTTISSDWAWEE